VRNLFYAFCHMHEKNSTCRYCWSCKIVHIHIQVLYKVWSLETNLGYPVMIEFSLENTELTTNKESALVKNKFESCCSLSLIYMNCSSWVHALRHLCEHRILKGLSERLQNDMQQKRPEKWKNRFVLHHDNALCHTSRHLPVLGR
jgi:hypothetical protein